MKKRYGIAIDIGTTTLTVGLIDPAAEKEVAAFVVSNPQIKFGEDVISRLDYCIKHKTGLAQLQGAIISGINTAIAKLVKEAGVKTSSIEKAVVVGNTVMEHFFLGVVADSLAEAPYVSILQKGIIEITIDKVGLKLDGDVKIYLLPIVKSFVGSDLTAGILYTKLGTPKLGTPLKEVSPSKWVNILVDIGTNGEIALVAGEKFFVTSTAAGPAFETSDKGMHGSEIIEAVSAMLKDGTIEKNGKLKKESKITQHDIRRVQYAKAAIMAGMHALVKKAGFGFDDIAGLYVGGKFGNFINKEAAVHIGLLPKIELSKIKPVGNTAYKGAVLALCCDEKLKKTEYIAKKAVHLSLFGRKEFQEEFVKNMGF